MTSSSCPPRLQTLPPSYLLAAVPEPRDSLVDWSLSLLRSRHVIKSLFSAPNQNLCDIHSLKNTKYLYSAPTEAVTWSIHCSEEYKIEVKNSPLPRPLSTYNSLIVLFPVTSESHSLWLVYVFTIVSSRNLPCLFTMPFSFQKHLSRNLYYTMWYSIFISHVFVPCPFSLPIYKIIHYILALKRNQSTELLFWSIASPNFKTKLKYLP